jgi:DNA-binding NarL/FixJ family response regulator
MNGTAGIGAMMANSRPDLTNKLSPAQRRVLEYLLEGQTESQIAEHVDRSRHTVHDHTKAIYQTFGVRSRVQLVLLFSAKAKG